MNIHSNINIAPQDRIEDCNPDIVYIDLIFGSVWRYLLIFLWKNIIAIPMIMRINIINCWL